MHREITFTQITTICMNDYESEMKKIEEAFLHYNSDYKNLDDTMLQKHESTLNFVENQPTTTKDSRFYRHSLLNFVNANSIGWLQKKIKFSNTQDGVGSYLFDAYFYLRSTIASALTFVFKI